MASDVGNVVEYLGRPSREALAKLVWSECEKIAEKQADKIKGRGKRPSARKTMAEKLDISVLTVDAWLKAGKYQASNIVATRLVKVAMELNEPTAKRIIRQGLGEFRTRFEELVKQFGNGDTDN